MGSWSSGPPQIRKVRYACFECRKAFKSFDKGGYVKCCPDCRGKVHIMDAHWYPPKKTDIEMWNWSKGFCRCLGYRKTCFNTIPVSDSKYEFLPNYKKGNK